VCYRAVRRLPSSRWSWRNLAWILRNGRITDWFPAQRLFQRSTNGSLLSRFRHISLTVIWCHLFSRLMANVIPPKQLLWRLLLTLSMRLIVTKSLCWVYSVWAPPLTPSTTRFFFIGWRPIKPSDGWHLFCLTEIKSLFLLAASWHHRGLLEPLLFVLYSADVIGITASHGVYLWVLWRHADICQLCSTWPADRNKSLPNMFIDINNWMSSNQLKLNADKTEFIWLATRQ